MRGAIPGSQAHAGIAMIAEAKPSPLKIIGFSSSGLPMLAGAYAALVELKMPLAMCLAEALRRNWSVSLPHFFASALENGRSDAWAFDEIKKALYALNRDEVFPRVKKNCIQYLEAAAARLPDEARPSAAEIAREMRFFMEQSAYHKKPRPNARNGGIIVPE